MEFAQQEISKLEDKILETMVNADGRNSDLKKAENELKLHTADVEKEKTVAREVSAKDEKELTEWKGKREGLRGSIDESILRHYDRVLKFRGSAIAEAINSRCSACQVMIRPQVYNTLRSSDEFITCDSCNRILYYLPEHDDNPVPAKSVSTTASDKTDNATAP